MPVESVEELGVRGAWVLVMWRVGGGVRMVGGLG